MAIVAAAAVITAWMLSLLGGLRFDYDFEAFFPNNDSELDTYLRFRENFDYDNEFVLIAPVNKKGIFQKPFLQKTDSLARLLQKIIDVEQVQSPTRLQRVLPGIIPVPVPALHFDDPSLYAADSARIYNEQTLVGSFFPEDARSLTLFVKTGKGLSKVRSDSLASRIKRTVALFRFDDVHVAGRIFAQNVYVRQITREFITFICISFVVVVLFLGFMFRTVAGVLLPLIVVLTSIVWTLGLMQLLGKPVDLLTTMLPTMVFIAGMSDVVHFFSRHAEAKAEGLPPEKIYPLILKEVGFPTFITLLTTVVAFLSLLFSSIKPVREFGIYTSAGITIAFILTYTLLPALIFLFRPRALVQDSTSRRFTGWMRLIMIKVLHNQKRIVWTTLALLVTSMIGVSQIRINNRLLEDLDESVRIKQDFMFFDGHYSGVRPFELQVTMTGHGDVWEYQNLKLLARIDSFIRVTYSPGFLVSPPAIALAAYNGGFWSPDKTFPDRDAYGPAEHAVRANSRNRHVKKFVSSDGRTARISGKIRDLGSAHIHELNHKLRAFIASTGAENSMQFSITGAAHLMDQNNKYMVYNMMQGFIFSVVMIALLTFALHRSWRMLLVFIVPNVVPLVIIAGIMGFFGIELKAATSIIFSIAFGIATDDTIHFISRLKIERGYGKNMLYAFKRTYLETGKPIVLTTLILLGGFMSMTTSDFQSTFYFGLLTCITIVIALLADLFLLPVLLFLVYRKPTVR